MPRVERQENIGKHRLKKCKENSGKYGNTMKMQRQDTIVLLLSDTITVAIFKYFLMQYFFKKFEDLIIFSKLILILTSTQHYDNDAEIPPNLYLSQIVLKKGPVI